MRPLLATAVPEGGRPVCARPLDSTALHDAAVAYTLHPSILGTAARAPGIRIGAWAWVQGLGEPDKAPRLSFVE